MAESLDDGVFWLPPQFLTDDDVIAGKNSKKNGYDELGLALEFPYGFGSFPFSSDLCSPAESVVGSTETESDEEDYLSGLTREMARATLEDDFKRNGFTYGTQNTKDRVVFGSPQSTLCAVGSGCGCRKGSSHGSPKDASRVSSPPTWDLLYAAAREVARMEMKEAEYGSNHGRGLLGPPKIPSPVSIPFKHSNPDGYYANQSLSHQKLQAYQLQQLKQQQMLKQLKQQQLLKQQNAQLWGKGTGQYQAQALPVVRNESRSTSRPLDLSPSAWPPLQQALQQPRQGGSDMRAVFLGSTGTKRECAGTGVFLPRQTGIRPETRKKPACSTVLVPARVVHALKLNLDEMGGGSRSQHQSCFNGSFGSDSDASAALRLRSNYKTVSRSNTRSQSGMNHEIRLPQDWSY
ncbi:uncharacterized protein LOC119999085 isoform X1 [Tripterygium wilfordii]|uniref:uncharacterized protein LOC119999085 isoform X1 n=1 Tax=Tripterygium wilfordii TaxID=458696 RepID=UPI0018F85E12|nr:uncharacterized protein LOC119999085 isoform X1 [Tripterygium wilfordii]